MNLTAKGQTIPFEKLPFINSMETSTDSIIHEQVRTFFKKSKAPGILISIYQNGKEYFYSYGYSDVEAKQSFTAETIFEIGSITKTFTANLLMQLVREKNIEPALTVTSYLPDSLLTNQGLKKISIEQVANHTSGLPRIPGNLDKIKDYSLMQPYAYYNREYLYSFLKNHSISNPGRYAYSNLGYGLLSTIMENVTEKKFEDLLNELIWKKLGMNDTYINTEPPNTKKSTGYFYEKPAEYWQFDCLAGAGAIKSNAKDMMKYLLAYSDNNRQDEFSEAAKMTIEPTRSVGENMQIGYAWHSFEDMKHRVYWHNGGTYGFSTFTAFEPITQTSLLIVSNAFNLSTAVDKLAVDLMILLLEK